MKLLQTSFQDGIVLNYSSHDALIGGEVAIYGTYEEYEMQLLLQTLKPGNVAIDIGANIGVYTLPMAKKVSDSGTIYAFEPDPTNFSILARNIADNNFPNVLPVSLGLADHRGEARLYLSLDNMGDHRVYDAQYRRKRKSIPIALNTLDTVLRQYDEKRKIATIKIDTQGYEPFVIRGSVQTIVQFHPVIFLEYWPFGYARAHADEKWMMDFLQKEYKKSWFIDPDQEKLIPLSIEILHNYFSSPERTESYCNLVFWN